MNKWRSILIVLLVLLLWPGRAEAEKIIIDAGHGGWDPGAVGANGLSEKRVNLDIADKLRQQLIHKGYSVEMTRVADLFVSLEQRVDMAIQYAGDLFVSIHANANTSSKVNGTMVLYYDNRYPQRRYPASPEMGELTPASRQLAQSVLDQVVAAAGTADLGLVPSSTYVVRNGKIPSILVETAFLSNPEEAKLLADDDFRTRVASGIAKGIEQFMPVGFADIAGHWAEQSIVDLKNRGIVQGEGANFAPEQPLTRAEFTVILDRLFDFTEQMENQTAANEADPNPAFTDLDRGHWAYASLINAVKLGYLQGYPSQSLHPDQYLTREEMVVSLDRIIHPANRDILFIDSSFEDVPSKRWSAKPIYRMKYERLVNGVDENRFAPTQYVSRAQGAAIIDRYMIRENL